MDRGRKGGTVAGLQDRGREGGSMGGMDRV